MSSIVVVNNYIEMVKLEKEKIMQAFPELDVLAFTDPILASQHVYNNSVKYVFTDIEMRPLNGFAYMKLLHKWNADLPIFLIGDQEKQQEDALRSEADGFFTRNEIIQGEFLPKLMKYEEERTLE